MIGQGGPWRRRSDARSVPRWRDGSPRVLHVIDSLRIGGAEVLLSGLVRELTASARVHSAVCAFSRQEADGALAGRMRESADALHLLAPSRLYDPRIIGGILRAALSFRADLVHSHLSGANITSRLAAAALRLPHVTTIHTVPGPRSEDSDVRGRAEGLTAPLSARLVAPSTEIAVGYATAFGIALARIQIVSNAPVAAPPPADFDGRALRADLLAGQPGPLVVCVARLEAEKGIDDLIAAAAMLRRSLPGIRIVVAGGGREEERLSGLVEAQGVRDTVSLMGPRGDVGSLLAVADAFCLPSRYEAVPISLLEALQAGLPCVATAVGGVPSVVKDGETALLVPPASSTQLATAIARVLTDSALAARLARSGRDLARASYSLRAAAERYADLYDEVLGRGPRVRPTEPAGNAMRGR